MNLEPNTVIETGAAALLFDAVFLVGGRVHPLRALVRDCRTLISFSAGMSAAYVFVHLMPEMSGARLPRTSSKHFLKCVFRLSSTK